MTDAATLVTMASAGLVGFAIVSTALLRAWTGWLAVRRLELESGHSRCSSRSTTLAEVASLKERVRKLEAIASGVDF